MSAEPALVLEHEADAPAGLRAFALFDAFVASARLTTRVPADVLG